MVLILEDFDEARFVIRAVLERGGYRVNEAANESQAVAICERSDQRVDLLISDVLLRGEYGTEIAAHIKALRPGMPILFISGYALEDLVNQGLLQSTESSPKTAFLRKPFDPDDLLSKVRELIAG